jgi:outer membrane protein OmpA-like peptidoglycan-associated protein
VVEVEVTDIPQPESKVTVESISMLREYAFYFEKENQYELSEAEEGKFVKWWSTQVDPQLREAIRNGQVEVELVGTASATGGGQYNRRLASRRIAAVAEALNSLGVAKIKSQAQGEYDSVTGEETNEDKGLDLGKREESRRAMRKVTMKFWEELKPPPNAGSDTAPSNRP